MYFSVYSCHALHTYTYTYAQSGGAQRQGRGCLAAKSRQTNPGCRGEAKESLFQNVWLSKKEIWQKEKPYFDLPDN